MLTGARLRACLALLTAALAIGALAPAALATNYPPPPGDGQITGTITDAATGAPMAGVTVWGRSTDGTNYAGGTTTDSNGNYSLNEPGGRSYIVIAKASDSSYSQGSYPGVVLEKDATAVNVTAGQTTSGISFALKQAYGTISGTVTNALTGAPAAGAHISVIPISLNDPSLPATPGGALFLTGADGSYSIQVGAGTFKVEFASGPLDAYWWQYSNGQASQAAANTITVAGGQSATANAALYPKPTISGKVTNASGAPVSGIDVYVSDPSGYSLGDVRTNSQGDYTVQPNGWSASPGATNTYVVEFDGRSAGYGLSYYGGNYPSTASRLTLKTNQTVTGIDGSLVKAGQITGMITDASGHPVNVDIRLLDPNTGALLEESGSCCDTVNGVTVPGTPGAFTLQGLTPGVPYKLELGYGDKTWALQYYNTETSFGAADTVMVPSGQTSLTLNPVMWRIGGQPPPPAPATPAQINSALTQALSVGGPAAKIGAILKTGSYPAVVAAPGPGTAQIVWDYVPPGAHVARAAKPLVVATGSKRVTRGGSVVIKLTLTNQGRTLLKHARRFRLTVVGSFTPSHGRKTSKHRVITITR